MLSNYPHSVEEQSVLLLIDAVDASLETSEAVQAFTGNFSTHFYISTYFTTVERERSKN